MIYLRLKFSDLQEIVSFIYTGQCKVAQDDLDGFLEIAKNLEIVGVANDEDVNVTQISDDNEPENVNGKATEINKNNSITRKEETDNLYEIKGEPKENAGFYCNECGKTFSSAKSLSSHKWVHSTKSGIRDAYFPEDEEQLTFFKSGRKEAMAYDKNFYCFMYVFIQQAQNL